MKWLEFPYHAVMNDRLELLELCLKADYDMRVFRLEEKETVLHAAVAKPAINSAIIKTLLKDIEIDTPSKSYTGAALHKALQNTCISADERLVLVNMFVKAGANLGPCNEMGTTALHSYCKYLRDCISSVDAMALHRDSFTIHPSSKTNNIWLKYETWKLIIDVLSVAYINVTDNYGQTPLHNFFRLSLRYVGKRRFHDDHGLSPRKGCQPFCCD